MDLFGLNFYTLINKGGISPDKQQHEVCDYKTGSIGKSIQFKEKELITYFDLDKRFLATNTLEQEEKTKIIKKKANV